MINEKKIAKSKLVLLDKDITELSVDAIVNAANKRLQLGGGVAGAIRAKGGEDIQKECDRIGEIYVGGAVLTTAGNLKAKYVIHAVGPRMGEGDEEDKLQNAVLNSLKVAEENDLESIAFPAISTGIFGYPVEKCADVMLNVIVEYSKKATKLKEIIICLWGADNFNIFANKLSQSKDI
jgi:O-acetyl-ADP-ribose deacetylase (regulator of RNase III)